MRMAIAPEEILQSQHVAGPGGPDQDRTGLSHLQQPNPAQDQGAHDAFAEDGFLHQHIAQPAWRQHDRLDVAACYRIDQRRPAGQLRQFAQEFARTMLRDRLASRYCATLAHIDGTLEHKGKPGRDFAGLHDEGAIREVADFAETAQPRDIRFLQKRKHLVAAGLKQRRFLSHARKRTEA